MNEQNKTISFQVMSDKYSLLKDEINDENIKDLYSKFTFKYLDFRNHADNTGDFLYNVLNKFKFITYELFPKIDNTFSIKDKSSDICTAVICMEGQCLIAELIKRSFFNNLLEILDSMIIDVNPNIHSKSTNPVNEEISSFNEHFKRQIQGNEFIKITLNAIIGYIIQRNFCPSNYFKNQNFFTKFKQKQSFELIQFDIEKMILINANIKQQIDEPIKTMEFNEDDFIKLRCIYSKPNVLYNLVIHIKTFKIYMMKIFENSGYTYEIDFCKNYHHRSFTPFYGFVRKNGIINGFIYEYMCNGNLKKFLLNKDNKVSKLFSYVVLIRFFEGIKFLNSKSLVFRDLKPDNILIDHDNIPYISDFETIRKIDPSNPEEELTGDIGSYIYVSPEQMNNYTYSFPTDIYSFGKTIYFLFEKNEFFNFEKSKSIPKNYLLMIKKCLDQEQANRPTIKDIENEIINDLKSFYFLEIQFIINIIKDPIIYQYYTEIYFLLFIFHETDVEYLQKNEIYLFQLLNFYNQTDISDILYITGDLYYYGQCVELNYIKAIEYYELSAEFNNCEALRCLGYIYCNGIGVAKNNVKGVEYLKLAAKQNDLSALCTLAAFYNIGLNVKQDYHKAKRYFELAAKQNDSGSINSLGFLYYNGYGVKQDYHKAKRYFELAAGLIYCTGFGVEKDFYKAKKYFKLAAKQNMSDAMINLGELYYNGKGVKKNHQKAKKNFERAIKLGNYNAYCNLAKIYKKGIIVEQDYPRAKYYYQIASEHNSSESFYELGKLYLYGRGTEKNYSSAIKNFEKSAQLNNHKALYHLGMIYKNGISVEPNYQKAMNYFKISSILNNPNSIFQLGLFYYYGLGVQQNYRVAMGFLKFLPKKRISIQFFI